MPAVRSTALLTLMRQKVYLLLQQAYPRKTPLNKL